MYIKILSICNKKKIFNFIDEFNLLNKNYYLVKINNKIVDISIKKGSADETCNAHGFIINKNIDIKKDDILKIENNLFLNKYHFIHIEKCAGKFIKDVFKKSGYYLNHLNIFHHPIRNQFVSNQNILFFCGIRNPLNFYISLYFYFKQDCENINNPMRFMFKNLDLISFIDTLTNKKKFISYLEKNNILNTWSNTSYSRIKDNSIGYFTYIILNTICKNNIDLFLHDNILNYYQNNPNSFYNVKFLRTENLNNDFIDLINSTNCDDKNILINIINSNTKKNVSKKKAYSISKKIKIQILKKDRFIFRLINKLKNN